MKKIKLGIIGTGEIAHHHIKVIKSFRDCEVTSVFNRPKVKLRFLQKNTILVMFTILFTKW